jgi:hypothetical protein
MPSRSIDPKILAVFLFSLGVGCGQSDRLQMASRTDSIVSELDKLEMDFGVVKPDSRNEKSMLLKNPFGKTVKPITVNANCTCIRAKIESRVFEKDEAIPVIVSLRAYSSSTDMNQMLSIHFDDKLLAPLQLRIAAKVREPLSVVPNTHKWSMGELKVDKRITISNFSDVKWDRLQTSLAGDWMICEIEELDQAEVGAQQTWACRLSIDTSKLAERRSNLLKISNPNGDRLVQVPLEVELEPLVSLFPDELYFVKEGEILNAKIVFRRGSDLIKGMRIEVPESISEFITVEIEHLDEICHIVAKCKKMSRGPLKEHIEVVLESIPSRVHVPIYLSGHQR